MQNEPFCIIQFQGVIEVCTRFYIDENERLFAPVIAMAKRQKLARIFLDKGSPLIAGGEVKPTNVVPVVAPDPAGNKSVYPMKWGFTDSEHGKLIINARQESASYKPTFKELWKGHRCVIPASYYIEWQHYTTPSGRRVTGDKYAIQPVDSQVTWMCGLYRIEEGIPVFVVLTREPDSTTRDIHDRMPVIIPAERIVEWITPSNNPDEVMQSCLTSMIVEKQ